MTMTLRPYQQEAHDEIIRWIKRNTAPCCIEAATGAGKSHIIAALADTIHGISKGKHILCLAPSAELVNQNAEKFRLTGAKCSIFSASAGEKSLRHPVVFGTPGTVINSIKRFGNEFAAVVIDECHGLTNTVKEIVEEIRKVNPMLRVMGMSATPYRMNTGYIFKYWADGKPVREDQTKDPYFEACVYRIQAYELIEQGFLTKPTIGKAGAVGYQTLGLELNSRGQFDAADIDRAFHGHGRKTAAIMADIVDQAAYLRGVMIFAATVKHAKECMASLPPELSALVTADTPKPERQKIIADFKAKKIKYLVNVSVLTTGFDAPHVDMIAILRPTESVGLLQQIIGRGLRVDEGKDTCFILDYAENLPRHCPDGDVFNPKVKAKKGNPDVEFVTCECEWCGVENEFIARPNKEGYPIDGNGYFLDLDNNRIATEWGAMPAHFGRRCRASDTVAGEREQCGYRWTSKPCPHCKADNDIAARHCSFCKGEIVNPNDKLKLAFKAMKKDPTQRQTDTVILFDVKNALSRSGNATLKVDVVTEYRSFSYWVMRHPKHPASIRETKEFAALGGVRPKTITYKLNPQTNFYNVLGYNGPADEPPE
jgi:DNA repair protein RadD